MRTKSVTPWLRALDAVALVPPGVADRRIDRAEALRLLRCDERVLDALVDHGLPCLSATRDQTFSWCDVMNIGLYSESRRSVAELAETFLVRFARGSTDSLLEDRAWRLDLNAECAGAGQCAGRWWLEPPAPELYGGRSTGWKRLDLNSQQAPDLESGPAMRAEAPDLEDGPVRAELLALTRGARRSVRSRAAKGLYEDALARIARNEWRFQYLPRQLRRNPALAASIGAMDCMSTSLLLAARCLEAGIEARTRKGYILLVNSIEHVWLEIRDDDGDFKPVDPMLAALALRHPNTNAAVATFMLGSLSSRLLPWDADAHTELFTHRCDLAGTDPPPEIVLRATPERLTP